MLVREILHEAPVTVPPTCHLDEAARIMADRGVGSLLVVSAGDLLGIVTDRDICVRGIGTGATVSDPVETVMTAHPRTIEGSADIVAAFRSFREADARRLPVLEEGELAGIISVDELLVALVVEFNDAIGPIARELAAPELPS
jgi:CBS domain-containing protein